MSHKDMNFADQVRLIQLVVGVPVDGVPSNTNAQAMTALTGISGQNLWKMSTEQFMDDVARRMESEPNFKAQILENISNVSNPQHQALLNNFASGAGVSLTAPQAQTQEQTQQQQQAPTQTVPPLELKPLNVKTANADALRLQSLMAVNDGDYSADNITGSMNQPTLERIDSGKSLAANIAEQEKTARETASLASLTSLTDMDLTQPNIMVAIQALLSALFGIEINLTGETSPQTEASIQEAHTLLQTRDDLIAEIAEHASTDLRVNMASVDDTVGLAITVKNHTMSFDKDALEAHGGSFKDLIFGSPEALIALEGSKGAEATTVLLDAAGLSLGDVRASIEAAPDSAEKTAFLARIDNGGVAPTKSSAPDNTADNTADTTQASSTQAPDPSTFFIPAMNVLNGVFEIVGAHPETGEDVVMMAIDPQMFLDPATYAAEITAYLDIAAQNNGTLTATMSMLATGTGNDAEHLTAIQAVYGGGNPAVNGQFNTVIEAAGTAGQTTPDNQGTTLSAYRLVPDMANNAHVIVARDAAGNEEAVDFLPMESFEYLDPNDANINPMDAAANAAGIGVFLDVAANDPAVLAQSINVIQNAIGDDAAKITAVQAAYAGGNQAVIDALAAIVPAQAQPANTQTAEADAVIADTAPVMTAVEGAAGGAAMGAAGGGALGHLADQATGRRHYRAANSAHNAAMEAYNTELDAMQDAAIAQNDYDEVTRQNAENQGQESAKKVAHTIIPQQDTAPANWRERAISNASRLVRPTRAAQDDIANIARERMGQAHADITSERTVRLDGDANGNFDLGDNGRQTLGFAYQDASEQITDRAQPGRARNWINNNVPLIGDTLRKRSEQRTAELVAHGETEIQDIDQKLDDSFETDAQKTIDERSDARPDVPENPTHPGDAPDKKDFNRNKFGIRGAVIGSLVVAGGFVLAAPANADELSPEVRALYEAGDHEAAGALWVETSDGRASEQIANLAEGREDTMTDFGVAAVAYAYGDYSITAENLGNMGVGEEVVNEIRAGNGLSALSEITGFAQAGRDIEAAETREDRNDIRAGMALKTAGFLTPVGMAVGGTMMLQAAGVAAADALGIPLKSMEDAHRETLVDYIWTTDQEEAFQAFVPELDAFMRSGKMDENTPKEVVELVTIHAQWLKAEHALDVAKDNVPAFYDKGRALANFAVQDARDVAKTASEFYETQHTALSETGEIMGVLAYLTAVNEQSEQPAPDVAPAPSPDTAVGAFEVASSEPVEIPEVVALAHDSANLEMGIISPIGDDPREATKQYAVAWSKDPEAMGDVVYKAMKEMMGGMEPSGYAEYLEAVNNYYGTAIASLTRPAGEAEAVQAAVVKVAEELGFTSDSGAPEVSKPDGGATSYKSAPPMG